MLLDIAALGDPRAADGGKPLLQVGFVGGIGVGAADIVEPQVFVVAMQLDFAERDADVRPRSFSDLGKYFP
jgi:hypothetical protein